MELSTDFTAQDYTLQIIGYNIKKVISCYGIKKIFSKKVFS
jgi:hypothetical protein